MRCPECISNDVYVSNPNEGGLEEWKCNYCGFVFDDPNAYLYTIHIPEKPEDL